MGRVGKLMKSAFKESDARIKTVNEILAGMRVIKYYAWEKSFLQKVRVGTCFSQLRKSRLRVHLLLMQALFFHVFIIVDRWLRFETGS
jgi:hypothetical protein